MQSWGPYGQGTVTAPVSDLADGWMLRMVATLQQAIFVDSATFEVTPGAQYQLEVTSSVPEASIGTGLVAVAFLDETGIERRSLRLRPAPLPLGEFTTDRAGNFFVAGEDAPPGEYLFGLSYPGDLEHWPISLAERVTIK